MLLLLCVVDRQQGAINSPALLQLSGVGNVTDLGALGIPLVLWTFLASGRTCENDVVVNLVYISPPITIEPPPASFLSAVMFAVDPNAVAADATAALQSHAADEVFESIDAASTSPSSPRSAPNVSMTDIELLFSRRATWFATRGPWRGRTVGCCRQTTVRGALA